MLLPHQRQLIDTLKAAKVILATDLDGTFLGGSDQDRENLYSYLAGQTHTALIFVTGRDKAHIKTLIEDEGIPRPKLIIADVGTSVLDGDSFEPVAALEDWIDGHWPGDAAAQDILKDHDHHLTLQDVFGGRRRSYFISDRGKAYEAKGAVEAAGYDAIVSDDTYFDVLPRGIQKGPTLLRVIETFGLEHGRVLAAGDTLNDLSLFNTGLKSVAVGNREPDLDAALPDTPNILKASAPGAAGILEALTHFDMHFQLELNP
ncbi:MAG: HAD-IIB family hydrolase [Pseudomonadota bacterium]